MATKRHISKSDLISIIINIEGGVHVSLGPEQNLKHALFLGRLKFCSGSFRIRQPYAFHVLFMSILECV